MAENPVPHTNTKFPTFSASWNFNTNQHPWKFELLNTTHLKNFSTPTSKHHFFIILPPIVNGFELTFTIKKTKNIISTHSTCWESHSHKLHTEKRTTATANKLNNLPPISVWIKASTFSLIVVAHYKKIKKKETKSLIKYKYKDLNCNNLCLLSIATPSVEQFSVKNEIACARPLLKK